jgi:uroporphyrinogen-III synthase
MVQDGFTLKGRTVAITRPRNQAEETGNLIKQYSGIPYFIPTIEIAPTCNVLAMKIFFAALEDGKVDYVLFMSPNGIHYLLNIAETLRLKDELKKCLNKIVVIAVGPKTAQELRNHDINVDLIPKNYSSESIVECLKQKDIEGKTIYVPRTRGATPYLANSLTILGAKVNELYVYDSLLPNDHHLSERFLKDLRAGIIDAIIFGSSLSVTNLFNMLRELISKENLRELLNNALTIVAIGPVTAETLFKMGLKVDVIPESYLFEEAIKALARYLIDDPKCS